MIGFMHYNKFGNGGFTDSGKGRTALSAQTCPVCLCLIGTEGGTLADGTPLAKAEWRERVCKTIKDDTVNGGYQGGCCAGTYPPF